MKPHPFRYHAPANLSAALEALASLDNARALAGGQSLMPMLNLRLATPDHLVDLGGVPELRGITESETHIIIGAMTTQRAIEKSTLVAATCPLLKQTIDHVGHQQTRNRGTIGGSLCHADPGAELPVALMALDGELTISNARGFRVLPLAEFPAGYLATALNPGELLTHIAIEKAAPSEGSAFLEFNRRPADFAIVSVAARVILSDAGVVERAVIAIGGVQSTPVRLTMVEANMAGHAPNEDLFAMASAAAARIDCDGDDIYPADYRAELCGVLTGRALKRATARAREQSHV